MTALNSRMIFGVAVPFRGRTSQTLSDLSPKRDCTPKNYQVPGTWYEKKYQVPGTWYETGITTTTAVDVKSTTAVPGIK